ncbi:MAG: LPS export ABC transporter ATP-binding protein [Phycisphaerae bacterium]|nr:LPS export ABC transporter ATP-binding protein [Phycisphaerae bacterium]
MSSPNEVLLDAVDLVKRYGGRTVVDKVSYTVHKGEIVGLLGRNGAGKTTSFRITVGMIDPVSGTVAFDGQDVTRLPMYKRAQLGMGYLSQEPSIFQRLTVEENLLAILQTLKGMGRKERKTKASELLEQFGLLVVRRQEARTLSGGERRKLEIARALVSNPKLILLDEPFSGVDPIAVQDLQREILHLRNERGIAILLTDHNVRETLSVTDRSYIIDAGKVLRDGMPRDLINDPLVRRTYLGSTFRGDEFDESPEKVEAAIGEKLAGQAELDPSRPDSSIDHET